MSLQGGNRESLATVHNSVVCLRYLALLTAVLGSASKFKDHFQSIVCVKFLPVRYVSCELMSGYCALSYRRCAVYCVDRILCVVLLSEQHQVVNRSSVHCCLA